MASATTRECERSASGYAIDDTVPPVDFHDESFSAMTKLESVSSEDLLESESHAVVSSRKQDHLRKKIRRIAQDIEEEQAKKAENVNEYLRLAKNANNQQKGRIKNLFETKNKTLTNSIAKLQRKLDSYQHRLHQLEIHAPGGAVTSGRSRHVLKDVGQGLNSIVSKPKNLASMVKNKFGSADDIKQFDDDSVSGVQPQEVNTMPTEDPATSFVTQARISQQNGSKISRDYLKQKQSKTDRQVMSYDSIPTERTDSRRPHSATSKTRRALRGGSSPDRVLTSKEFAEDAVENLRSTRDFQEPEVVKQERQVAAYKAQVHGTAPPTEDGAQSELEDYDALADVSYKQSATRVDIGPAGYYPPPRTPSDQLRVETPSSSSATKLEMPLDEENLAIALALDDVRDESELIERVSERSLGNQSQASTERLIAKSSSRSYQGQQQQQQQSSHHKSFGQTTQQPMATSSTHSRMTSQARPHDLQGQSSSRSMAADLQGQALFQQRAKTNSKFNDGQQSSRSLQHQHQHQQSSLHMLMTDDAVEIPARAQPTRGSNPSQSSLRMQGGSRSPNIKGSRSTGEVLTSSRERLQFASGSGGAVTSTASSGSRVGRLPPAESSSTKLKSTTRLTENTEVSPSVTTWTLPSDTKDNVVLCYSVNSDDDPEEDDFNFIVVDGVSVPISKKLSAHIESELGGRRSLASDLDRPAAAVEIQTRSQLQQRPSPQPSRDLQNEPVDGHESAPKPLPPSALPRPIREQQLLADASRDVTASSSRQSQRSIREMAQSAREHLKSAFGYVKSGGSGSAPNSKSASPAESMMTASATRSAINELELEASVSRNNQNNAQQQQQEVAKRSNKAAAATSGSKSILSDSNKSSRRSLDQRSVTSSSPKPPVDKTGSDGSASGFSASGGVKRSAAAPVTSSSSQQVDNRLVTDLQSTMSQIQQQQQFLNETMISLKNKLDTESSAARAREEEERYRAARLDEQLGDMTDLQQHEISNIKQEIASLEEKIDYKLEERTRDMQEMLENCQNKIGRLEMQQQHQQFSSENLDTSNFRNASTRLINLLMAAAAVLFVLISLAVNVLNPFVYSKTRVVMTILALAVLLLAWTQVDGLQQLFSAFGSRIATPQAQPMYPDPRLEAVAGYYHSKKFF